ncbi:MAG TPA: V-type ATP synthase subunit F [Gaiellaceae bacterium]|nr:V-type ATP synthase subunit F [Gaiellaceae bacterium]
MKTALAIGDGRRLAGYALAGALVAPAATPEEARAALGAFDHDIGLVILTPEAGAALEAQLAERDDLVVVVLPS